MQWGSYHGMEWGHIRVAPLLMFLYNGVQKMLFLKKIATPLTKLWKSLLCIVAAFGFDGSSKPN